MRDSFYLVLLRAQSQSIRDHLHGCLQQTAGRAYAGLRLMTAADASNPRIAVFSTTLGMGSDSERLQGWKEAKCDLRSGNWRFRTSCFCRGTRNKMLQSPIDMSSCRCRSCRSGGCPAPGGPHTFILDLVCMYSERATVVACGYLACHLDILGYKLNLYRF